MDSFDFNFCHALSLFAATSKTGETFETCEFLLTHSKGHKPEFNLAVFKQPHRKLSRAIERSLAYYARLQLPFRVHLAVDEAAVNAEFEAHGFVRAPDLPFMLLTKAPSFAPVAGLTVCRVKDAKTLGDFQRIAFESFDYPVQYAPVVLTDELAKLAHVELFVGYVNDVACCCSALIITADIAGIYWVGTLTAQRRQGLGAAITAHAAKAGLAHEKQGLSAGNRDRCTRLSPHRIRRAARVRAFRPRLDIRSIRTSSRLWRVRSPTSGAAQRKPRRVRELLCSTTWRTLDSIFELVQQQSASTATV